MEEFSWFVELIDEGELLRDIIEMFGIETLHILNDQELRNAVRNECIGYLVMKYKGLVKAEPPPSLLSDVKDFIEKCTDEVMKILLTRKKLFKPIKDEKYKKLLEMKRKNQGVFKKWLTGVY